MAGTKLVFFAARRYWGDPAELAEAYEKLGASLAGLSPTALLVTNEQELAQLGKQEDCLVVVPMSGAVQRLVLAAAQNAKTVVVYPMYINGNASAENCRKMLRNNAAPTTMDCWAVLKRSHPHVTLALSLEDAAKKLKVMQAFLAMQSTKLLLVGSTEPWVISNSGDFGHYARLGVEVVQVPQSELARRYHSTSDAAAEKYYHYFLGDEHAIVEPSGKDILDSARMAAALAGMVESYDADAVALACFNLLSEGTNCCLGVSYLNDCTPYVVSCEGDIDSAVTMLAMKQLANTKLWMANPGLHPGGIVNFSHCTAPLNLLGGGKCRYSLRSHHESGIGIKDNRIYDIDIFEGLETPYTLRQDLVDLSKILSI